MRRSAWGFRGGQGGAARGERGRSSAPLLALRSVGDRRLQRAPLERQAGRRWRRRRGQRMHGRGLCKDEEDDRARRKRALRCRAAHHREVTEVRRLTLLQLTRRGVSTGECGVSASLGRLRY